MQLARSKRILIVEDDQVLVHALGIRLRAEGYRVTIAPDGGAAIIAARTGRPDLILLDLGLPGVDGMEVLSRLKTIPAAAQIPVIVMTARDGSIETEVLQAGAALFLQKPVENDEFQASIASALEDRNRAVWH